MTAYKTALIALSLSLAAPAFAGGPSFPYMPNMSFPPNAEALLVTKNAGTNLATCTQLERAAQVQPDACETFAQDEQSKRKLQRNQ